jgi:hypothetical protein
VALRTARVFLPCWPVTTADPSARFTTVSNWWDRKAFVELDGQWLSNEKRTAFREYLGLPSRTNVGLELTLTDEPADQEERRTLEQSGWRIWSCGERAGRPKTIVRTSGNRAASSVRKTVLRPTSDLGDP